MGSSLVDSLTSTRILSELLPLLRNTEAAGVNQVLIDILEVIVTDITKLQADVQALQDAGHAAADELGVLAGQVASLQQGGVENISQADIDALSDSVSAVTDALASATSSATTTGAGGSVTGGTTTTSSPAGPGPTVTAPSGTTAAPEPAADARTVYTFDGDVSTVSPVTWPNSGLESADTPTPQPLFFFVGDTKNMDGSWTVDGEGAGWSQYTGATQPAGTGAQTGSGGVTPAPGAESATDAPGAPTPRSSQTQAGSDPASGEASGGVVESTASEPQLSGDEEPGWSVEDDHDQQVSPGG